MLWFVECQYDSLWHLSIKRIVNLFGDGSIVQRKLSHFCVDHGILGWGFAHSKHQFIVDRGVECDQAEVEGKFNDFWAYPGCLVRWIGFSI